MPDQDDDVLAVGCGPFLLALAEAWYGSGLARISVFAADAKPADIAALKELAERVRSRNPQASLSILTAEDAGDEPEWEAVIRPFQFVLYVSEHGGTEELQRLQRACIAERKPMLPAIAIGGLGFAGPLLQADGRGRWESAWRRIHASVFSGRGDGQPFDAAALAVISNLLVYEWQKTSSGETKPDCLEKVYILDPAALTGGWHSVLPHPLLADGEPIRLVAGVEQGIEADEEQADAEEWLTYLDGLTSRVTGIFHIWEEAELYQLPLSQCLVQPADPLSEGPAELMPVMVRSGLTHEEARRESGLAGLEAYAARIAPLLLATQPSLRADEIGIGAGAFAEAVGRGLRAWLARKLAQRQDQGEPVLARLQCAAIDDLHCRFYLQALRLTEDEPLLAAGEPLLGFPVVWVHSGGSWYGSADFNLTLALRQSLQKALDHAEPAAVSSIIWSKQGLTDVTVPSCSSSGQGPLVLAAIHTLQAQGLSLKVFDLRSEPFLSNGPFGVYGVLPAEEESL